MKASIALGVVTAVALVGAALVISPMNALNLAGNPFGSADGDNDRIVDALEAQLCSRALTRDQLATAGVGRCASSSDYIPPEERHLIPLYSGVQFGADADHDGLPATVTLTSNMLIIDPFQTRDAVVRIQPTADKLVVAVDTDDHNADTPVPTRVAGPHEIPLDWALGKDKDRDSFPESLVLKWATFTVDRSSVSLVSFKAGTEQVVPVDLWDADPDMPVVSVIPVSVPVAVFVSGDNDRDLVPGGVSVTFQDFKFDRRGNVAKVEQNQHTTRTTIDADDGNRDNYAGLSAIDRDADFFPDAVEHLICLVQSDDTPQDGTCVGADGKGADGSGDNYVPPVNVQSPWNLNSS